MTAKTEYFCIIKHKQLFRIKRYRKINTRKRVHIKAAFEARKIFTKECNNLWAKTKLDPK